MTTTPLTEQQLADIRSYHERTTHPDWRDETHVGLLLAELDRARARAAEERAVNDHLVSKLQATLDAADEWMDERAQILAEHALYEALQLGDPDGRVSAACGNPEHPTWLRKPDDTRSCPWCEVEQVRAAAFREAARVLEHTGRDDDAVNLLDNIADGITPAAAVPSA